MKLRLSCTFVLATALCAACAGTPPSQRVERMYIELVSEVGDRKLGSPNDAEWRVRQESRVEHVLAMIEAGELTTALDHFHAAVILVESDDEKVLLTALGEALRATELKLDRAFRVAAEATDKVRVKRGVPQKYGTQYMYEPVLKAWRLYPVDPATSDVERKAFGVEPLAELVAKEAVLNQITGNKPN